MVKYMKISKILIEKSSIFFVILNEDCRRPRKLLFETELYESLTDLTEISKQSLKLMKFVILGALGAQGGYLELARPCHRITLIELDLISSTSH